MLKFIISRFVSREKAVEILEEHEEKITDFSEKNPHLATAVKTSFRLWSIWKTILLIWWGFLVLLCLGAAYTIYMIVSRFI